MIKLDENNQYQALQMETAMLLSEAVGKATALGFTVAASGGTVDVLPWQGRPLMYEVEVIPTGSTIFEAGYIENLIDWLDGVAYGRANVNIQGG